MKKMKRVLVALLSCLTAFACLAGTVACGKDEKKDSASTPSTSVSESVADSSNEEVSSEEEVVEMVEEVPQKQEELKTPDVIELPENMEEMEVVTEENEEDEPKEMFEEIDDVDLDDDDDVFWVGPGDDSLIVIGIISVLLVGRLVEGEIMLQGN